MMFLMKMHLTLVTFEQVKSSLEHQKAMVHSQKDLSYEKPNEQLKVKEKNWMESLAKEVFQLFLVRK